MKHQKAKNFEVFSARVAAGLCKDDPRILGASVRGSSISLGHMLDPKMSKCEVLCSSLLGSPYRIHLCTGMYMYAIHAHMHRHCTQTWFTQAHIIHIPHTHRLVPRTCAEHCLYLASVAGQVGVGLLDLPLRPPDRRTARRGEKGTATCCQERTLA